MGLFKKLFGEQNQEKRAIPSQQSSSDLKGLLKKIISESDDDKLFYLKRDVADLGKRAIIPLVDYLKSDSADWRKAAAEGIEGLARDGGMNGLEAVILNAPDPLIQTLKDDSPAVRKAAVNALRQTLSQYYNRTKHMDMLNSRLRTLVCNIFKPLVSILDDGSIDVRLAAADVMHSYSGSKHKNVDGFAWGDEDGAKRAREIFIECLNHESADVRKFAAKKLRYDEDENIEKKAKEEIKGQLLQALEDGDEDIRVRAAIGLGELGDKRAVEPLIQILKDKRKGGRVGAAINLGTIGDKEAVESLIQIMKDKNEDKHIRCCAARSLGKIGDAGAMESLIQASNDENVREAAEEALEKIK